MPTGVGQTEMQVATIAELGVNGYVGTPSFLKLIVEKADELKVDISCLKKARRRRRVPAAVAPRDPGASAASA